MKNALSNVNGWLGGLTGLLKTVVVFFVFPYKEGLQRGYP